MKRTPSAPARFDDVNLILRLYDMRREERMRQARAWFVADFKARTLEEFTTLCPAGSEPNASYRMVTGYWEMVASFIASGVLNPELFYQSGREMLFVYSRLRHVLPALRKHLANELEMKNLETVARGFIEWWNEQAPGAYDAFCKRIGAA
jgi:hypothetical protein